MYLRIPTLARDRQSLLVYVVVEFWGTKADADGGAPPVLINDFLMQLAATNREIRVQSGRWLRADGVLVRPQDKTEADDAIGWQYITRSKTNTEMMAEAETNILSYWQRSRAAGVTGDKRGFFSVDEADPDGVLALLNGMRNLAQEYPAL